MQVTVKVGAYTSQTGVTLAVSDHIGRAGRTIMYVGKTMKTFIQFTSPTQISRVVRGGFPDREFDVVFWQEQGDEAIFDAAWAMVALAEEFKGPNVELKADFKELLHCSF